MPSEIVLPSREAHPPEDAHAPRLTSRRWLAESLRCAFFGTPRIDGAQPTALQVAVLFVLYTAFHVGLERLTIAGPARFVWQTVLTGTWPMLLVVWLAWLVMAEDSRRHASARFRGIAAWLALGIFIEAPMMALLFVPTIAAAQGWLTAFLSDQATLAWTLFALVAAWALAAQIRLTARYVQSPALLATFAIGFIALSVFVSWKLPQRYWLPAAPLASSEAPRPRLQLTQAVIERQQAVAASAFEQIAGERAGISDVYAIVFAPYAGEEVFRRESTMVADVLRQRFDADGRTLLLLNHAETSGELPWATPENLRRGIAAVASRMDRENDLIVIYMTSHGGSDFKLAAEHPPLSVEPLTAQVLREALDAAAIRKRVLIISACYSGGWIAPLADASTLVMTAADAEHTSYGCGLRSELTFFGRAMFDEQLRQTRSFTAAFENARRDIARREVEAGKDDGFSNPQISVGAAIAPELDALAERLDGRQ